MFYVNEIIKGDDKMTFSLGDFDRSVPFAKPSDSWVIDRDRGIFLRTVLPSARRNEPGDPEAVWEKDFHFHWRDRDFYVRSTAVDAKEMAELPGSVFSPPSSESGGGRIYRFYIHGIGERGGQGGFAIPMSSVDRLALIEDLRSAFAAGYGGGFFYAARGQVDEERHCILKLAPGVGEA